MDGCVIRIRMLKSDTPPGVPVELLALEAKRKKESAIANITEGQRETPFSRVSSADMQQR